MPLQNIRQDITQIQVNAIVNTSIKERVGYNIINNKIKAVMIGHAVGDALGVPVEFCSREELTANPITDMVGYGSYPTPPGTWSDDTSMALAALDSLSSGKVNAFEIMVNFSNWLSEGSYTPFGECFDVGRACLYAIHTFAERYYSQERGFVSPPYFDATECGQQGEFSNGNGSLMRIHPFALMTWYREEMRCDWESIIDQASALTHAHKRSKLACKIYTIILHELLENPSKESILSALANAKMKYSNNAESYHYARLFDADFAHLNVQNIKSSGYVVDTLEAALWCALTTASYQDCVLKAVNLGDDTDTVAAVAGSIAGALYGYDSIPAEWLGTLKRKDYIEEMCDRASKGWLD